jgi:methionine-rich copper-binding protein CopC
VSVSPTYRPRVLARVAGASLLAALLLLLVPVGPAHAHNALVSSDPERDAVLTTAPTEVSLKFLQELNPSATTIVITNADKRAVATADPVIDGATGVVTFPEPLANGKYTVAFQVLSMDGHAVKGSYSFTVDDPNAAPAPTPVAEESAPAPTPEGVAASQPTEAAAGETEEETSTGLVIGGVVVVLLLAAGGLLWWRRSTAGR